MFKLLETVKSRSIEFNINLNKYCEKILSFWSQELDEAFDKHIKFFKKNLENQKEFNSKMSEILKDMDLFDNNDETENNKNEQNNEIVFA